MSNGKKLKNARKGYDNYLRYAGLGFTMMEVVLAFTFGGWWLDQQSHWPFPIFTLTGSLLGITGAMVHLFKETARK